MTFYPVSALQKKVKWASIDYLVKTHEKHESISFFCSSFSISYLCDIF
jgi:hypothetical protein